MMMTRIQFQASPTSSNSRFGFSSGNFVGCSFGGFTANCSNDERYDAGRGHGSTHFMLKGLNNCNDSDNFRYSYVSIIQPFYRFKKFM